MLSFNKEKKMNAGQSATEISSRHLCCNFYQLVYLIQSESHTLELVEVDGRCSVLTLRDTEPSVFRHLTCRVNVKDRKSVV